MMKAELRNYLDFKFGTKKDATERALMLASNALTLSATSLTRNEAGAK